MDTSTLEMVNYSTTVLSNTTSEDATELLRQLNDELAVRYIPVMVYIFLLMLVGIPGNILVLYIYKKKSQKTSTDFFIMNLAILDLMSCVIGMPTEIADLRYPYMFYSPAACKLFRSVESVSNMAATLTLIAIAVDRYRRICQLGKTMTTKTAKVICAGTFAIGVATQSWPPALVFGQKKRDVGIPGANAIDCSTDDAVKGTVYPLLYYGFLFIYFVACVVVYCVIYGRISYVVWRQRKFSNSSLRFTEITANKNDDSSPNISPQVSSTERDVNPGRKSQRDSRISSGKPSSSRKINITKTTAVVFAVTAAFVLSFLPFLSVMVIRNIKKDLEESLSPAAEVVYKFCLKSYFVNNAINPVIYSFMNVHFRQSSKTLAKEIFSVSCCYRNKSVCASFHNHRNNN